MTTDNKILSWDELGQNFAAPIAVTIEVKVTEADYCGIIIGSFEGGSTYWVSNVELLDAQSNNVDDMQPKDEPVSTYAFHVLRNGGAIKFHDTEPDDTMNYNLTYDGLKEGLAKFLRKRSEQGRELPISNGAIEGGDIDADDADAIIQLSLFGDVVYG